MSDTPNEAYGWNPDMQTPLLDKLKADLKQSMLQKDVAARSAIRQIMAEFPKLTVPITLESGKKSTRLKTAEYKNKMQAMGTIMKHFGKQADGKMVNEILKQWE